MSDAGNDKGLTRRQMLLGSAMTLGTAVSAAAALSPLIHSQEVPDVEELLRLHYRELTVEDKEKIFAKVAAQCRERYGKLVDVADPPPLPGVEFAYILNLGRCIGCRKCVYACMKENNLSRTPQKQYIRVLEMDHGGVDLEASRHDYPEADAAKDDHFFMPVACHQCEDPPCVKVCPVQATWQEPDGIVVVDYSWCIGCRYCQAACPYHARRFNYAKPGIPAREINPDMGYLSNRPRPMGVMEKCTFCLHRVRRGEYPACLEACPAGARKFGNLNDPDSEVRTIIEQERVYVLKQEAGTRPRFYYVFAK